MSNNDIQKLDLIQLVHSNPYAATKMFNNALEYESFFSNKKLTNIPIFLLKKSLLNQKNYSKLITVQGTVIKIGLTKYKDIFKKKICNSCDEENENLNFECDFCGDKNLVLKDDLSNVICYQTVKIQDLSENDSLQCVECLIDLQKFDNLKIGYLIACTGIVILNSKGLGKKIDFNNLKYCLKVLDVKLEKEISVDDYTFFNKFSTLVNKRKFLIENFCSRIIGFNEVKLGLILSMFANKKVKERSNSHILLIGPSFTGKTTFLKYVCRIMSPSRFVNGVGTSEVGLTACAVKEDGEWSLDTGALIATDGGACCIDGINYLDIKEKNGLLEAMEQQTISVAKAGINAKFKTCCTIIGSATLNETIENYFDGLGMSKPLLSRFDLIFYLKVNKSRINSMRIADEILNGNKKENLEELKNYLKSVKENLIEENDEAKEILIVYCRVKIEKTKGKEDFNTCRMLEGLLRLAKAHCKISCRNLLSEEDAFVSILLFEASVKGTKIVDFDAQHVFTNEIYFKEVVQSYKMIFFN